MQQGLLNFVSLRSRTHACTLIWICGISLDTLKFQYSDFQHCLTNFMSINSSKDFKKWTAIGCHNLNHLICWQFLSTGRSLLMVDLLVFRSSSSLQIFGFFQVSHLLTDSHRMLHGLMWCIQVMGISFPFHKLKSGYWIRWILCDLLTSAS